MHILIIGAAGMLGHRLTEQLVANGRLGGGQIASIHAVDVIRPAFSAQDGPPIETEAGDVCDPATVRRLVGRRPDVIFHLAAVVSGEAETDFDKGYDVNLDGTRQLLEAVRQVGDGYKPRLVFTSSIAVFGAPFPEKIDDTFLNAPLTSYGTQKAIGELLLADYTRKGVLDGVGIRLPTIVVRPGKPNKAASGFFSSIIREPLAGQEAILPVADTVRAWVASPTAAVGFLLHAANMDTGLLGDRRSLTMPGLSVSVAEMIEALRRVAGPQVAGRIRHEPDPEIAAIVAGWPRDFSAVRAEAAGFRADADFDTIICDHIADEEARSKAT